MHIEDQVTKAIQTYADALPNDNLKVNLMALAEHMSGQLIEILGLKQEWAVLHMATYTRLAEDGTELPLMEEISQVTDLSDDYQTVHHARELRDKYLGPRMEKINSRVAVGGRLFTDWSEDVQPQVDPELEALLNLPGT